MGSHLLPKGKMPRTPPSRLYLLTKSKFMAGRQCLKKMYLDVHHRERASPTTEAQQAVFDFGHVFGERAHQLFPGGQLIHVGPGKLKEAQLEQTQALLADRTISAIFEATFLFKDILVQADILERQSDGTWHLIECKSTLRAKEEHQWDMAVQAYVLEGCGVQISRCSLMHIRRSYRHGGVLNVEKFITATDISVEVQRLRAQIPDQVEAMKKVLMAPTPPAIEPDAHCTQPHECNFWAWCTKQKPAHWIGYLPDGAAQIPKLATRGIRTMDDIPPGFPLSSVQKRAVRRTEWRGPGLRRAIGRLRFPIHYLHIEAAGYGIPLFPDMRPYERIPFQWTILREFATGIVRQKKWVDFDRESPPARIFVESLLAGLGSKGSIVIYSDAIPQMLAQLVQRVFRGTARKALMKELAARFVDLRSIIRKSYYHPKINYAAYAAYDEFSRGVSIHDLIELLPRPERFHLIATLDRDWASRQYRETLKLRTPQSQVEHFREQVLLRSSQVVRALYETGRLLRTPAPQPRKRNARRARAA